MAPGVLDELDAHDRVLVEKTPRVLAVRTDPADHRGEVEHHLGALAAHQRVDRTGVRQIAVAAARHHDLLAAAAAQHLHDRRAEKPRAARDQHPFSAKLLRPKVVHFGSAWPSRTHRPAAGANGPGRASGSYSSRVVEPARTHVARRRSLIKRSRCSNRTIPRWTSTR